LRVIILPIRELRADFVLSLLTEHALYREAHPLIEAVLAQILRPELQILAWGTLALASAGVGQKERYHEAREYILKLVDGSPEYAAAALVNSAEGARLVGEWDIGKDLAAQAAEVAHARRDPDPEQRALKALAEISAHEPRAVQAIPPAGNHIEMIARRITYYLQARKRPARRPVKLDLE